MIKALGRIRTPERLYQAGELISGLPLSEEKRLIKLGVAEPVQVEQEQKATKKKSAQPKRARKKKG